MVFILYLNFEELEQKLFIPSTKFYLPAYLKFYKEIESAIGMKLFYSLDDSTFFNRNYIFSSNVDKFTIISNTIEFENII